MTISFKILVINPGSTSTKLALFENESSVFETEMQHTIRALRPFRKIRDQHSWRRDLVRKSLSNRGVDLGTIDAVVGRGGLMKPVSSGTYMINERMIEDLKDETLWGREHASNLGCMIAYELGKDLGVPAFTVDPVTVNEMSPEARISGFPEIERRSIVHALNIRATAIQACEEMEKNLDEVNLIIAHLGGGISICAYKKGKIVDVNNALLGMGPFSPQRAGSLPIGDVIEICYSGKYKKEELLRKLSRESGLTAYLGTDKIPEILCRKDDKKVQVVLNAMIYQIAKEIGAMAAVLEGRIDGIVLTGGMAASSYITRRLGNKISFLAPVRVYPKQSEMKSLAQGALRVLLGKEKANIYR